jgi:hypothetical protein
LDEALAVEVVDGWDCAVVSTATIFACRDAAVAAQLAAEWGPMRTGQR